MHYTVEPHSALTAVGRVLPADHPNHHSPFLGFQGGHVTVLLVQLVVQVVQLV